MYQADENSRKALLITQKFLFYVCGNEYTYSKNGQYFHLV